MAVTKTHPIKSTLKAAIDYILNPEKTDGKGHIPVRGKGLRLIAARRFFRLGFRRGGSLGYGGRRVVAFIATARISGNRKAAHDNQCGKQYGKLSDYLFILHCRCPPVRRGKWLPAAAR